MTKTFLENHYRIRKVFALCVTEPDAQELNAEIGFFKAVKSGIMKLIHSGIRKRTAAQIDDQLNELISKSIISKDVGDVYDSLGLANPDILILSN